ncbi:sulfur oxidation c-type cytochrome SoxX [Thioalkalivibrio sulfidiphilus]
MGSPEIEQVKYTGPRDGDAEKGERIALNVRWGNCLACHSLPKGHEGGTIGPNLSNYGARGLPFEYTFQRIWDGRVYSPNAHMPVYGPNGVLSVEDILDVIAFIESGK